MLCVVHAFRYIALASQSAGNPSPLSLGADALPAALALTAALLLHARKPGAIQAAWVFNLVGLADIAVAAPLAMADFEQAGSWGLGWQVFAFYLPALVITHLMMLRLLFRHAALHESHDRQRRDQPLAA